MKNTIFIILAVLLLGTAITFAILWNKKRNCKCPKNDTKATTNGEQTTAQNAPAEMAIEGGAGRNFGSGNGLGI